MLCYPNWKHSTFLLLLSFCALLVAGVADRLFSRAPASASAGLAGGLGFFRPLGVSQGGFGVALVGEAADPEGAAGLWA